MSKGTGKPCGNSFIPRNKTCRLGAGSFDLSAFSKADQERMSEAIDGFMEKLDKTIPPEGHDIWAGSIEECIKEHARRQKAGKNLKGETYGDHFAKQLKVAEEMMTSQPRYFQIGEKTIEAPPGLIPSYGWKQAGWVEPVSGITFNRPGKNGATEPKAQSGGASWAQIHIRGLAREALDFRASQEAAGKPWPLEPTQKVDSKEVDAILQKEGGGKGDLWMAGGNIMDTKKQNRQELLNYYNANEKPPSETTLARREAKARAIIESWKGYGGIDPINGKPIGLPNTPGATVDHKIPISTFYGNGRTLEETVRLSDRASNFYVTGGGLQGLRRDEPWDKWLDVKNTPKLDQGAWSASLSKGIRKNPPVMTLSKDQFQERFKALDYNNPADRQTAAMSMRSDLLKVYKGDSSGTITVPTPAPKTKAERKAQSAPSAPPKPEATQGQLAERRKKLEEALEAAKRSKDSSAIKIYQNLLTKLK